MPKATLQKLQSGFSQDETDRIPKNITVTNLDIFMYVIAILGHFVDVALDLNVAVRYFLADKTVEFGWTLAFILVPAFINTLVSIRITGLHLYGIVKHGISNLFAIASFCDTNKAVKLHPVGYPEPFSMKICLKNYRYSQDKELGTESLSNTITREKWLRIFILVLQMAPILRFMDALIYALKSRRAERKKDEATQRMYYSLMLKEDSDAALLRIFECFLEAAPQQVLQTCLLFRQYENLRIHQMLSICSSIIGMGWCLAAYQRAIRFAQQDKLNMNWFGSVLQVVWHFSVTLSRIVCISIISYLFPMWTVVACFIHIFIMTIWLQIFDPSPFCSHNKIGEVAFSFALGGVYLFTYILPSEGRTRYRYTVFYGICFLQNITCTLLWYFYVDNIMRQSVYYELVLIFSVVPYIIGLLFMVVYYMFFHPKVRVRGGVRDSTTVNFKANEQTAELS